MPGVEVWVVPLVEVASLVVSISFSVYWFWIRKHIKSLMCEKHGEGWRIRDILKQRPNVRDFVYLRGRYVMGEADALDAPHTFGGCIAYYLFDVNQVTPTRIEEREVRDDKGKKKLVKEEVSDPKRPLKVKEGIHNNPSILQTFIDSHAAADIMAKGESDINLYLVLGLVVTVIGAAAVIIYIQTKDNELIRQLYANQTARHLISALLRR